ncbi:4Fe-4S dicluster domain-containing protein [Geoglobus acetivorans]|uniref:4Fe-4S dicluster domain-containing protein n=1 Tax=Geoglobus acetivorans TaxID=565033 RepID=A0ABZ3H7X3_GEOAI|nr:4Fe-4S dicluster domain-containing protein [Geoglobus acetivorans]
MKSRRMIIAINHDTCISCGRCVESCPTGALKMVDGKVQLIDERLCDGFGSCIAVCPTNSLYIEERDAEPFDWSILEEIDFDAFIEKLYLHYRPAEIKEEK